MARIRTVKPELFRHEGLFEAECETALPLRLAFIGLFTIADRDGRFRWQPRQMKLDVMPYDETDFSRVLDALMTRGFIVKYAIGTELYGAIPTFSKHQVINNRERASDIPCISCADRVFTGIQADNQTENSRVDDASATPLVQDQGEGKGRELEREQGKEQEGKNTPPEKPEPRQKNKTVDDLIAMGVNEQHAKDWMAIRKAKRAPLTETALDGVKREADLAGLTLAQAIKEAAERGWQGFKAEWLKGAKPVNQQNSRHHGFDNRDYTQGLNDRGDGTYEF